MADDEPNICHIVQEVLSMHGYSVETAGDGQEALEKLGKGKFDLVILDVHMPRMEGIQVLEIMRSSPKLQKIGAIMMTSESMMGTINQAFKLGAKEYILKPFKSQDLLAKVNAYFNSLI